MSDPTDHLDTEGLVTGYDSANNQWIVQQGRYDPRPPDPDPDAVNPEDKLENTQFIYGYDAEARLWRYDYGTYVPGPIIPPDTKFYVYGLSGSGLTYVTFQAIEIS